MLSSLRQCCQQKKSHSDLVTSLYQAYFKPFCYDVTHVLWRFSPERERATLQTSCGAERVKVITNQPLTQI